MENVSQGQTPERDEYGEPKRVDSLRSDRSYTGRSDTEEIGCVPYGRHKCGRISYNPSESHDEVFRLRTRDMGV